MTSFLLHSLHKLFILFLNGTYYLLQNPNAPADSIISGEGLRGCWLFIFNIPKTVQWASEHGVSEYSSARDLVVNSQCEVD